MAGALPIGLLPVPIQWRNRWSATAKRPETQTKTIDSKYLQLSFGRDIQAQAPTGPFHSLPPYRDRVLAYAAGAPRMS